MLEKKDKKKEEGSKSVLRNQLMHQKYKKNATV